MEVVARSGEGKNEVMRGWRRRSRSRTADYIPLKADKQHKPVENPRAIPQHKSVSGRDSSPSESKDGFAEIRRGYFPAVSPTYRV